jgi:hypothetical protein
MGTKRVDWKVHSALSKASSAARSGEYTTTRLALS